jgi:hypothetical protein
MVLKTEQYGQQNIVASSILNKACILLTLARARVFFSSNVMVVKAVVKVAVKMEQMQIPIIIQKMEKSRPKIDLGALSPYLKSNMEGYCKACFNQL